MSSPRSSDSRRLPRPNLLAFSLCAALLASCAAGPGQSPDSGAHAAAGGQPGDVPPRILALYERSVAAMAAGDLVEAELRFGEFLLQNPGYTGAHVNLAILTAARGDDDAAMAHVHDALLLDPEHPSALNQLGIIERRRGRFAEAEAAYLKAVAAVPDYALAHYNLGVLNELYLQRYDAALRHFERYLDLGGEDEQVEKWVADLKRRVATQQRTANVTE